MKLINLYSFGKGQKAQAFSLPAVTETARTADILADVKQKLGSWWFSDWLICERSYGPGDLKKKKKQLWMSDRAETPCSHASTAVWLYT